MFGLLGPNGAGKSSLMRIKVAVLDKGKLNYLGSPLDMIKEAEGYVWHLTIPSEEFNALIENNLVVHHMTDGDMVKLKVISETNPYKGAVQAVPNLEDAYLWLLRRQNNNDYRVKQNEKTNEAE